MNHLRIVNASMEKIIARNSMGRLSISIIQNNSFCDLLYNKYKYKNILLLYQKIYKIISIMYY
jgi:hypothetical protein